MPGRQIVAWPPYLTRAVSSQFALGTLNGAVQPIFQARANPFSDAIERRFTATFQSPNMGATEITDARGRVKASWREVEGRVADLKGRIVYLRLFDPHKTQPIYNLQNPATPSTWADGSAWSDGGLWVGGRLPPFVVVDEAANEDAQSIVVRGFSPNVRKVLSWGDPFEVQPNGMRVSYQHYYWAAGVSNSNSAGKARVYFNPGLSARVRAGDMIRLKWPTCVMALIGDAEGMVNRSIVTGTFGMSLIGILRSDS